MEKFAGDNGYKIVAEYVDEGISGWKSETRKAFTKLIADAERGDFKAVLCWDQDRFSRFDPLEANHYWYLLDRAGVHLATVAQGRLDWHDLGGWLSASVAQHGKAQYVRDLARNVSRGMYAVKKQGKWCGRAPFGYELAQDGKLKPGKPQDVAVVRRLYESRAKGLALSEIAKQLNREGIATPRGSQWRTIHVRTIIDRVAYKGATPIGVHSQAKFSPMTAKPEIVEGTHEPLVSCELWDTVQAMPKFVRAANGRGGSPGGRLSGLAYCSRCGAPMYCNKVTGGNYYYLCGNYHYQSEKHESRKCGYCCVKLETLEEKVFEAIKRQVLFGSREKLIAAIDRELNRRGDRSNAHHIDHSKQIAKLSKQIEAATERLLLVDEDLLATAQAKLRQMIDQRDALAEAQAKQQRQTRPKLDAEQVAGLLWELPKRLAVESPEIARATLQQMIERIDLDFEKKPQKRNAKRVKYVCTGGKMVLRTADAEASPHLSSPCTFRFA